MEKSRRARDAVGMVRLATNEGDTTSTEKGADPPSGTPAMGDLN